MLSRHAVCSHAAIHSQGYTLGSCPTVTTGFLLVATAAVPLDQSEVRCFAQGQSYNKYKVAVTEAMAYIRIVK